MDIQTAFFGDPRGNLMWQRFGIGIAWVSCLLLAPTLASAQSIGGTVTDETGGVLPGVTVEARSPALIEQVRAAVSDGAGQYLIVQLEPGVYSEHICTIWPAHSSSGTISSAQPASTTLRGMP